MGEQNTTRRVEGKVEEIVGKLKALKGQARQEANR